MQIIPIIEHREPATISDITPWVVRDVLRPDGKYGIAEKIGEPDTYFSQPARMSINGQKVRGWITVADFGKNVSPPGYSLGDQHNNGWDLRVWVFHPNGRTPVPVRRESRICFGLEWFATESEAREVSEIVARTERINGGWRNGEPCGRAPEFDRDGEFAVIRA